MLERTLSSHGFLARCDETSDDSDHAQPRQAPGSVPGHRPISSEFVPRGCAPALREITLRPFHRFIRMKTSASRPALRMALLYVVFGGVWMLVLDHALSRWALGPETSVRISRLSGWVFVGVSAVLVFVLLGREFSDRRHTEEALQESRERLRLAAAASNVGFWDWDLQTQAVYFSPEWKRQLGYAEDEISNTFGEWERRIHPDDLEPTRQKIRDYLARPLGAHEMVFRLRHKDGSYRWIYARAQASGDTLGRPVRLLGCHVDITAAKQAETALRQSQEQLRALARRLQSVREEESRRIARELHDQLGHVLTALKMDLRGLERELEFTSPGLRTEVFLDKLLAASGLVETALRAVQQICAELRPAPLDQLGLGLALRQETRQFEQRTGIPCRLCIPPEDASPPLPVATALYRICQEALTNVARHAGAHEVVVELRAEPDTWQLEVRDDGRGLAPEELASVHSLGLVGMRERAAQFGGELQLLPRAGGGTVVRARIPRASGERSGT